ncbi:hypothetical protein FHR24_001045 [Wenyingzhuangia heitensis]|uniref:Cytochrome P460 n=1 Tax=Wenyingzhuangia heitensis TaxID=1487859 RepID=A0ABX0UAW9_9FLAO|nr:hypothetical protein [Wenyingzhuangia heitensis]NIJ44606.1 hypothetical protein [Wenyingzhuangia heitensis]
MKKLSFMILGCAVFIFMASKAISEEPARYSELSEKTSTNVELQATFPTNDPKTRTQANFDNYAWQMFVALNWPADTSKRGVANSSKKIGDSGTVVWQTFRTSESIFLPNGQKPAPWNTDYTKKLKLSTISKVDPTIKERLSSTAQAVGGPLVDQNLQYTYYEKYMNQTEFDFIYNHQYYDAANLAKLNTNMNMDSESMEVKSAWKIMGNNDTQSEFFTCEADIENIGTATVGLVGLHIIYKSKNSPQWVWATFEHTNNAPTVNTTNQSKHFSYYNPECPTNKCPENKEQPANSAKPNFASQVVRTTPIPVSAQNTNTKWQKLLQGTVWKNYQLITMQWPADPNDPGNPQGTPTPNISANTTMETYIQQNSSCMGCHSTASFNNIKTDYSFLFLEAQSSN